MYTSKLEYAFKLVYLGVPSTYTSRRTFTAFEGDADEAASGAAASGKGPASWIVENEPVDIAAPRQSGGRHGVVQDRRSALRVVRLPVLLDALDGCGRHQHAVSAARDAVRNR